MVFFAKDLTDLFQGSIGVLSAKIHDDLSWKNDLGISLLGDDVLLLGAVLLADSINDKLRSDDLGLVGINDILKSLHGIIKSYIYIIKS